jgi:hypothetical protein
MTNNLICYINKLIITILLICYSGYGSLNCQEQISGVINSYAKINTIGPGYVVITNLSQVSQFTAGDYVLIIQMQGVGIQTTQGSYGINVQTLLGKPGGYELLVIQAVNYSTGRIDFTRNVYLNNYDVAGNLQLIKVPFYDSAVVSGNLLCQGWNAVTGTGGVLAMMVSRKLSLNADIDVSGLGFAGAAGVSGIGECVYINETANNHDSYALTWNNAGFKGEGVAIHDQYGALLYPNHAKGQGRNFSGGGGGNGRYSGGGGGSNRGKGADGGLENALQCSNDPRDGGYGGMNIIGTVIQDGIFAGGGGGASTQAADGSVASSGGNGGGIVIIIADTIEGNNHYIKSNGISASNAVSNAGAGGGGAGGSLALFFRQFAGNTVINSNGGNGGSNSGGFGEGGGGGGGLIWLSSSSVPSAITSATVNYGIPAPITPAEGDGELKFGYSPNLNGFLFNTIWSARTGNRTDSVCSDVLYGQIRGTNPVGGTAPYTFRWEISTTSATAGFSTAPGTNNLQNYTPPALLTQTTWIRRVVTDYGAAITDVSLPIQVIVHPYVKNNAIGNPDTLCYGQDPSLLYSVMALQDGNGHYTYQWESSTDNSAYNSTGTFTESYLPPPGLTQTSWYRRIVHSGSCVSTSAPVRINVLEPVSNNTILTPDQEICQGMTFNNIEGTIAPTLSGGDNTYRFRWEVSTDGSTWINATGIINTAAYNPGESTTPFPGVGYFRRVVFSGSNDVCENKSEPVTLGEYPQITNNFILSPDQTICSGAVPLQLAGSVPLEGKGAGTYTYTWQDSSKSHSWSDITGYINVTSGDFLPSAITDTTSYRRIAHSSACSDISAAVRVNVHKPVSNNIISLLAGGAADTTICYGATPHLISGMVPTGGTDIPGSYDFQWEISTDNSTWAEIATSATGASYQPSSLNLTTWFRRRAASGECFSESVPVKVNVLPTITNNTISADQIVCKGDLPGILSQASGSVLSGGAGSGSYSYYWEESSDGIEWIPAEGTNNSSGGDYQPPVMTRTMQYRRNVSSGPEGCCSGISNAVQIVFDSLPPGTTINAGPDTSIYSFDLIIRMNADPVPSGSSGHWSLLEGSGSFENPTENDTRVTGVALGLNRFMWTITRGACKMEDEVDVLVYDLVIPEGFSPNNDPQGYNNTFVIKGLDLPNQEAELVIVNGAGTDVFSTSNRNGNEWLEWDGKNSKEVDLPEGTYYYLLKITSKLNGQVFKKSGFIVLKRY